MTFLKNVLLPWFVFAAAILCSLFFVKHSIQEHWPSVHLQHLDRLRPEKFEPFCLHPQENVLRLYQKYFEDVDLYFKHSNAQALGLLGYCAFQQQDWQKAGEYYRDALRLESGFFWYAYNLAICLLKQEKFIEAVPLLVRCLGMDTRQSVLYISMSKQLYAPIVQACLSQPDLDGLVRQLEDARQRAKDILVLLQMKSNRMPVDVSTEGLTIAFY